MNRISCVLTWKQIRKLAPLVDLLEAHAAAREAGQVEADNDGILLAQVKPEERRIIVNYFTPAEAQVIYDAMTKIADTRKDSN